MSDNAPSERSEPSPRSGAVFTQDKDPDLDPGWTRKRLRPQTGRGIEVPERRDDKPVQAPSASSKIGTARKRKAASTSSSKIARRSEDNPVHSIARRVGHSDRVGEMRQMISELQSGANQPLALTEPGLNTGVVPCEAESARLFQVVPTVARQIEESVACEQLSRIRNCLALARFYRAYRAAQAQPEHFLHVVNHILPTSAARSAAPNHTKRAEVKSRFIDLVFNQTSGQRNRKKDSTRVNDWQTSGRPWFDMISRFGNGVLLLIPAKVTNDRQVSWRSLMPLGTVYLANL